MRSTVIPTEDYAPTSATRHGACRRQLVDGTWHAEPGTMTTSTVLDQDRPVSTISFEPTRAGAELCGGQRWLCRRGNQVQHRVVMSWAQCCAGPCDLPDPW